jgi:uncharacterized membrane protein YuzA (DUF378 family)
MARRNHHLMDEMTTTDRIAGAVLTLGALNWALVGAADFDVIRATLGRSRGARAVYGLIGASAAYGIARGRQLGRR